MEKKYKIGHEFTVADLTRPSRRDIDKAFSRAEKAHGIVFGPRTKHTRENITLNDGTVKSAYVATRVVDMVLHV